MLVLFLDGMGQGIVFPIFSKSLFNSHSTLLAATNTVEARNIWYGILVGIFFLCWFIGAAVLSDFSDKNGRKKALIICPGGSVIGSILSAMAFTFNNVWILLLGRIIGGFTNGSQPIAQASIVDTSPKDKLSRNFGLIVMSVSLRLVAGPLLGGFLSNSQYASWFSDSTPLYFAGILALLNILLLLIFYHETSAVYEKVKIHLTRAIEIFVSAFSHRGVRYLATCFFFFQTGWAIYYIYISAYTVEKFGLTRTEVTLIFALVGLGLTFGLAILEALFERWKFERKSVVLSGFGVIFLGTLLTFLTQQKIWVWLATFPIGAGFGFGYAFLLTFFSNEVARGKQG